VTENSETPKILDQISKGTGGKSGSRSTRSQQNARRRFYILLFLFIPLLAGLAYLALFQVNVRQELVALQNQNSDLANRIAGYEQQISALNGELAQLPEQLEVDDSATQALSVRLESELNDVRAEMQSLTFEQQQVVEPQPPRWKILEAQYLLSLAARKLQFESDINAAITLLQQADESLQASGSSNVFAARQAIGADLNALRSVEQLDSEGIYIRLQNLVDQVTDLPLRGSMRDEFQNQQNGTGTAADSAAAESGLVARTFDFLGTVFVWREWDEMPEAMLAPGQDLLIRQRLRLTLEQLQLALSRRDAALFNRGLAESLALFESTLVSDEPASQVLLTELRTLQEIDINPPLPGLSASLDSVGQLAAALR